MTVRYFFHLRDDTDEILDPEGSEMGGIEEARAMALLAARDTLSHEMKAGRLNVRYRIDVEDERGRIVHTLPLGNAFEFIS